MVILKSLVTGIEAFTNIVSLQAFDNLFTSIDLSNNTKLTQILVERTLLNGDLDLSMLTALKDLKVTSTNIDNLNIANGNNTNFTRFEAQFVNNLCIQVDDVAYSTTNWPHIANTASYNSVCTAFITCFINIPDSNFKSYLVNNTNINTDGDVEISCDEAIAYSGGINISNSSISDLTGIEAFTEIISLTAFNNNITGNINLSNNTKLTTILLENNNITGDVDLSALTALDDLKIHSNDITNLNVANGNNTNFTRFEAYNSPSLICVEVDNPNYSSNNSNWLLTGPPLYPNTNASYSLDCGAFLSTNKFLLENFKIFPNPVQNTLTIDLQDEFKQAEVYSVLGKIATQKIIKE